MADISEWSPTDDANTNAPPNGWPEFMQPSAVNNSARALMGAVRRWYDTITAQLASVTTSLATKVNRAGDTMTGSLGISSGGNHLVLNKPAAGNANEIWGQTGSSFRWLIQIGGSDENFWIHRYNDAGAYLGSAMLINRVSGGVTFPNAVSLGTSPGAADHATRKDYVDQRDSDYYSLAWSNITGWAAGQDAYYYNAAITHANTLNSNQQTYIDNTVSANVNDRVYKGGDAMWGALSVPYIYGGAGGSGTLRTHGNTNSVCFRWGAGGDQLSYRVDEAFDRIICYTRNWFNVGIEPGGGGPTNYVLGGMDGTTWFYCHVDLLASDERIKSNITDSEIDAVGLLGRVQLSRFDVKPAAVAWVQSVGKEPEERARMMREAKPAHVEIGFIAQQVREVIPEAVFCADQHGLSPDGPLPDDLLTINNQMLVPYLVRAVQQLSARVEALEGK